MFERFSADARRTVVLAREEARSLHHDFVGTEHLMLALNLNQEPPARR
ncbi:Clp protease N-terminal domain-containing protein [Bacillus mobilis]